jgi:uncharacterized membrane protein YgdD (TMEM256/DUF423 family)
LRIYNRFILSLAVAFSLINILLASLGQEDLAVYFNANAIVYMVVALAHANLNQKAQTSVKILGTLIFIGSIVTVALRLYQIAQL